MRRLHLHLLADEGLEASSGAVECVALGHGKNGGMSERARSAAAGAVAAAVWGLAEPLDRALLRHDYSDIALLGKLLTRGRRWRAAGFAVHAANGALFGLAFSEVRRRVAVEPRRLGVAMALAEHAALFPLGALVDRYHPARGEPGVVRVFSWPAFAQATWRHALFGWLLGRLARA
jgi:hypothetical protein